MPAAARILDANANRAREALRVLEDAARFALDDARLSAQLKSLRHDLREALAGLAPGWLEANRDTAGDVGTAIEAPAESERGGLADVAVAAGKRLGEALRVIEEVGKTIDPGLARDVEAIRYRFYDVEGALHLRLGGARARQWRVCV
ncbi:MAG: thiamine phosphate synthase, partial [Planctomycetota bacterium]